MQHSLLIGGSTSCTLPNFGMDTVTDFNPAEDYIRVSEFSNIAGMSQLSITQDTVVPADTLITFSAGNVLRLQNVTATSLTAANFEFAVSQVIVGDEFDNTLEGGDGDDSLY